MRHNSLLAWLVGVLFMCGVVTAWLSIRYFFSLRELQTLQAQAVIVNSVRNAGLSLANDAVEYSRRNPAIVPLLQQFQVLPRPAATPAAPAAAPASKAPAK